MDKIENVQVAPGKVLVKVWVDKELEEKAKALDKIVMNDEQKQSAMIDAVKGKIGSVLMMKATLVNIGYGLNPEMAYKVGEHIYVFPNTFDADFVLDGQKYYIYSERNILAKVKNDPEEKKSKIKLA